MNQTSGKKDAQALEEMVPAILYAKDIFFGFLKVPEQEGAEEMITKIWGHYMADAPVENIRTIYFLTINFF